MKKMKIFLMAAALLLIPLVYQLHSAQIISKPHPVEPTLVRQGDFALSLVEVLKLGTAFSEAQAQKMLDEVGISPKSGWISDYPMAPDIMGELQDATGRAADNGYLTMNRSEALNIFQDLATDYGLPTIPEYSETSYSETPPPPGSYDYTDPAVINHYYYQSGPPVVTYFPPPSGYYNLYSWVPYPFWWGGFWFSGYFVLNDFHRTSRVVILSGFGTKRFRSPRTVIGVVSNRSKKFFHTKSKKRVVIPPSKRKLEGYGHPGIKTGHGRWSKPDKSGTSDRSRFLRRSHEQRRRFDNNAAIRRGDNRSNVRPSFNRSAKRFRGDTGRRQINNRSFGISGYENRIPSVRQYRRSFGRSSGATRSFQGRDHSSFQRLDRRSGQGSVRSWNRGVSGGFRREFRKQGAFSRGGFSRN
jgi:hypothetical protein